jgi:L-cystine uptake protein TcyP (sodium:dicarboxylate symporter family)
VINNVSLSDIENEKTLDKKVKNLIPKIKSMELSVEKNMDNILSLMFYRTLQIMDKVLDVDNIQDIDNNLEENGEDY